MVGELEKKLFQQRLPALITKLGYSRRLGRAWQLIERDYADPNLSLERAAKVSGLSKNHLNVLLREKAGFTFYQLLIRYRLSRALNAMKLRNYSLLEIALENGFRSLNAFEIHFRNVLGTTPKKFRENRDV
jgi:two-component system response regulator YesN